MIKEKKRHYGCGKEAAGLEQVSGELDEAGGMGCEPA